MKPSELSYKLRRIAAAIDNSENPSRKMVATDIQKLIHKISGEITNRVENYIKDWHKKRYPGIGTMYDGDVQVLFSASKEGSGAYNWKVKKSYFKNESELN